MNAWIENAGRVALLGLGATAVMDAWIALLQRLGVPSMNLAMVGRWVGHWRYGRWRHQAIAKAPPVRGELALGWLVHYATGVGFAFLLVGLHGLAWLDQPTISAALCTGLVTVAAPWLLMQPAMGAGVASSRTPAPMRNRFKSLVNHAIFGAGLYLTGVSIDWVAR